MKTRLPTSDEMQALVAFLPRLYSEGFEPVLRWNGGRREKDGVIQLPWPEYNPVVEAFYREAARECWLDYDYQPEEAARMLADEEFVRTASLAQVKSMLTYCLRGERFADGHRAEMIENGNIRRLLERVAALDKQGDPDSSRGLQSQPVQDAQDQHLTQAGQKVVKQGLGRDFEHDPLRRGGHDHAQKPDQYREADALGEPALAGQAGIQEQEQASQDEAVGEIDQQAGDGVDGGPGKRLVDG
jgi:hypothetical protein